MPILPAPTQELWNMQSSCGSSVCVLRIRFRRPDAPFDPTVSRCNARSRIGGGASIINAALCDAHLVQASSPSRFLSLLRSSPSPSALALIASSFLALIANVRCHPSPHISFCHCFLASLRLLRMIPSQAHPTSAPSSAAAYAAAMVSNCSRNIPPLALGQRHLPPNPTCRCGEDSGVRREPEWSLELLVMTAIGISQCELLRSGRVSGSCCCLILGFQYCTQTSKLKAQKKMNCL